MLGGNPLDELEAWVEEAFAAVPGGRGPRPDFGSHPFPFAHRPSLFVLPAVKDQHSIHVTFQLPPQLHSYGKKAEDYISHLVGHEGRGSLLSALKARGLATDLSSGVPEGGYDRNTNVFLFGVSISLTEKGLEQDMGLGAVGMLFEYLGMLRAMDPERCARTAQGGQRVGLPPQRAFSLQMGLAGDQGDQRPQVPVPGGG